MPITDSIGQLIEGVSFVFGRLCSCHSVIALGGQFSWNWSKVAVNRDLLNVERAVWFPVFWTCHRPHHVSGVRGPGNGSLFFRWIAYVIYSGSCLIPLRRSPSATAIKIQKYIRASWSHIAKTPGPTPTRHRSDTKVSDRCPIDADPTASAIRDALQCGEGEIPRLHQFIHMRVRGRYPSCTISYTT